MQTRLDILIDDPVTTTGATKTRGDPMDLLIADHAAWTDDIRAAVRSRDHIGWLGEVLETIALEALGREAPRRLDAAGAGRLRKVIGQPVASAAGMAIDQLAADLARALANDASAMRLRSDDERRRAELGLD